MRQLIFLLALAVIDAGCLATGPNLREQDGRLLAASRDERAFCGGLTSDAARQQLDATSVDGVDPAYDSTSTSKGQRIERLVGAELRLRPAPTITRELLERLALCHRARVVLGRDPGSLAASDPYALPDGWVDVDVRSGNGAFVVVLRAENSDQADELLARARRFAASVTGKAIP